MLSISGEEEIDKLIIYGNISTSELLEFLKDNKFDEYIQELKYQNIPVLAINKGLHVLFDIIESENTVGLGIFEGRVRELKDSAYKKNFFNGWLSARLHNRLKKDDEDFMLFDGIVLDKNAMFYFNQRTFIETNDESVIAMSDYSQVHKPESESAKKVDKPILPVAFRSKNFWGIEFLPEKSNQVGLKLLKNFVEYEPPPEDEE